MGASVAAARRDFPDAGTLATACRLPADLFGLVEAGPHGAGRRSGRHSRTGRRLSPGAAAATEEPTLSRLTDRERDVYRGPLSRPTSNGSSRNSGSPTRKHTISLAFESDVGRELSGRY
jgi:hypothetical protein